MKITTFNPQIITKDAGSLVELFEKLGFSKRHKKEGLGEMDVTGIRMKDENGFYLDISQPDLDILDRDLIAIRMNVDDFDEAYKLLIDHGFKNIYGDKFIEDGSSKAVVMLSSTGFAINLVQHIK